MQAWTLAVASLANVVTVRNNVIAVVCSDNPTPSHNPNPMPCSSDLMPYQPHLCHITPTPCHAALTSCHTAPPLSHSPTPC